jgi:transposase
LLDDTAKIFSMKELSADAGYLSKENVKAIAKKGAIPFIMGKRGVNVPRRKGFVSPWGEMLRAWKHNQMYFAEHYHRRSNVESTFSMVKKKFGDFCRAKKSQSQENEILSRIVVHNAVVLAEALLSYDLRKGFVASL